MLFNSFDFLLFFLVVFPVTVMTSGRPRQLFLVAASGYFYAQWNVKYLGLVAVVTVLDFCAGLLIERFPARKRWLVALSVASNLGILGFFKYYNFLAESLVEIARLATGHAPLLPHADVLLPVGISFYTFESLSYVIDVYRGKLRAHRSILEYALFISFFPHLVAGPIIRPAAFLAQLGAPARLTAPVVHSALVLFLTGLAKKVVLADNLALLVDPAFADPAAHSGLENLLAVYAFAFQIYFDFSGYTDMAIALAQLFGIYLPENFTHPYGAASLREFWRRWHISLSTWLRDYLYVSLGGNRKGKLREYVNVLVTMLLGGLWHGASVNFLVWGGLHGFLLVLERPAVEREAAPPGAVVGLVRGLALFHVVCLTWIFFRADDLGTSVTMLGQILGGSGFAAVTGPELRVLLLCGVLWLVEWVSARGDVVERLRSRADAPSFAYLFALSLAVVVFGRAESNAFIYFQF